MAVARQIRLWCSRRFLSAIYTTARHCALAPHFAYPSTAIRLRCLHRFLLALLLNCSNDCNHDALTDLECEFETSRGRGMSRIETLGMIRKLIKAEVFLIDLPRDELETIEKDSDSA